jgi:CRP-like cAMP-binding protein
MLILQNLEVFNGLPLNDIKKNLKFKRYKRQEIIFHIGEVAEHVFIIINGTVKISYATKEGDEKTINIFQAGDIFGDLFLGKYRYRIGTAKAIQSTQVAILTEKDLLDMMQLYPQFSLNFTRHLADRQRETIARMHALMHLKARHRLLGTLLQLSRKHPCDSEQCWYELPQGITHEDLANFASVNRTTASLLIAELKEKHLLEVHGRTVRVNQRLIAYELEQEGVEILE